MACVYATLMVTILVAWEGTFVNVVGFQRLWGKNGLLGLVFDLMVMSACMYIGIEADLGLRRSWCCTRPSRLSFGSGPGTELNDMEY